MSETVTIKSTVDPLYIEEKVAYSSPLQKPGIHLKTGWFPCTMIIMNMVIKTMLINQVSRRW
jgi:hypothetical protein